MDWFSRRRASAPAAASPGGAPGASAPSGVSGRIVAPLDLLTATERISTQVELGEERLIDVLNAASELSVLDGDPRQVRAVPVDQILLVLPPAQPPDPRRHLHRLAQPVRVRIGPWEVSGDAQVPPGAIASGFILRANRPFFAITHALIRHDDAEGATERAGVVLVNLRRLDSLRDADRKPGQSA